ncbi:MAG: hypothetical protein QW390_04470 [Candidatus Bathyarchaeia archaeon]
MAARLVDYAREVYGNCDFKPKSSNVNRAVVNAVVQCKPAKENASHPKRLITMKAR